MVFGGLLLFFVAGLGSSFWIYEHQREQMDHDHRERFDKAVGGIATEIEDHSRVLYARLNELRASVFVYNNLTLQDWNAAAASILLPEPGMVTIRHAGYVERVTKEGRAAFLAAARLAGQPNFEIHSPESDEDLRIVQYVAPATGTLFRSGQNIALDSGLLDATDVAAASGAVTSIPTTISEDNEQYIILFRAVYSSESGLMGTPGTPPRGWVYIIISQSEMIDNIDTEASHNCLIYLSSVRSKNASWTEVDHGNLTKSQKVIIGDQQFDIWVGEGTANLAGAESWVPFLLLSLGCIMTTVFTVSGILVFRRVERLKKKIAANATATHDAAIQRRALSLMTAATDNGVIITDTNCTAVWVNEGIVKITGAEKSDLVGTRPLALIFGAETSAEAVDKIVEDLKKGEGYQIQVRGNRPNGDSYFLENEIRAIRDINNTPTNFLVVSRDITGAKHAELERERSREAALRNAEQKVQFTENLTRELRTHLTGAIGMTKMLLETSLSPEQREMARTARSSGERLGKILEDIRVLSHVESGLLKIDSSPFDLRELVEDMVELFAEDAAVRGLELVTRVSTQLPAMVAGDAGRIRQVLANLLCNALHYTDVGEVTIDVACAPGFSLQSPEVIFSVNDSGIGILPSDLPRLFQPFSHGMLAKGSKTHGPGLGLAVSRHLVQHMGGKLTVESTPGKGSIFKFNIPFRAVAGSVPSYAKVLAGKSVFLIEDHDACREAIVELLTAFGADVTASSGGAGAIGILMERLASRKSWDAIVLDQFMPIIDGNAIARSLREELENATIPIVYMSTLPRSIATEVRAKLGIHTVLAKPVRASSLRDAVLNAATGQLGELAAASASAAESPQASARPAQTPAIRRRALVVEDDVVCQKVARALLKKLGWQAVIAANGREGFEQFTASPHDVILMDCQMPEMDGFEATVAIRAAEGKDHHTPIIAMTANAADGDRERCISAGMDNYISKPLQLDDLRKILEPLTAAAEAAVEISAAPEPSAAEAAATRSAEFENRASRILMRLLAVGLTEQPSACETTVRSFVGAANDIVVSIRTAMADGELNVCTQLLQRLQRASAHFGAEQLAEFSTKLLEIVESGKLEPFESAMTDLEAELKCVGSVALELVKDPESLRSHGTALGIL